MEQPQPDGSQTLTINQARRLVLRWQGLLGAHRFRREAGALSFVRQAGCLQFDPVDVCGKNAELVLFSRVKGFQKPMLGSLLYKKRALVEHWDKNMAIYPAEDWPRFARAREQFRGWTYTEESHAAVLAAAPRVLAAARARGVVCSADIDLPEKIDWPWAPARLSRATLEYLYFGGALVVHHRQGTRRYYAPAENHLPADLLAAPDPCPGQGEYHCWHTRRRIAACGLLWNKPSDAFLGIPGFGAAARAAAFARLEAEGRILPLAVEGLAVPLYVPAEALPVLEEVLAGRAFSPRLEFIAPLDSLIWDRRLVRALFGFDYTWEIYTPVEKRRYGHYVLPVLWGAGFAGRVEALSDRAAGALRVAHFWPEPGFRDGKAFRQKLTAKLAALAAFNGCEALVFAPGWDAS